MKRLSPHEKGFIAALEFVRDLRIPLSGLASTAMIDGAAVAVNSYRRIIQRKIDELNGANK